MTTPPLRTLIAPEALRSLLGTADVPVLIDTGFDLADPAAGDKAFAAGHLPGALYLHLDRDLCGVKAGADGAFRGRHPLPERAAFAATLGRAGITPESRVVAYDAQGSMFAARLWWMLRWMGHVDAAVLDGGTAAWVASGSTLQATVTMPRIASPYPDRPARVSMIDASPLSRQLGRVVLIDARAPERFRGDVEPLDRAAGHIPGALNRCFKHNLDAQGRFRPSAALRAEFDLLVGDRPATEVVHQCGSGVTACHNLLAMEHVGLTGSALYAGSWSEWSADPTRPVATGG